MPETPSTSSETHVPWPTHTFQTMDQLFAWLNAGIAAQDKARQAQAGLESPHP